jgi:hypothetical protein
MITDLLINSFERHFPVANRIIFGKRYLLPPNRQNDYANQDHLDVHLKTMLTKNAVGEVDLKDASTRIDMCSLIHSLKYERPTLYLERELGEILQRTDLPHDLATADVRWPWPGFRVMLPKGLCSAQEHDGTLISLHCIDPSLSQPGETVRLRDELLVDLFLGLERAGYQVNKAHLGMSFTDEKATFFGSGITDFQMDGFLSDSLTWALFWDDKKLGEIVPSTGVVPSSVFKGEVNTDLLERARHLILNILLFLSQEPVEYKTEYLRTPRIEGKHFKPGLARARFVGECQPKSRRATGPRKTKEDATGTHAPHWVRGHWSRIAHGKGRTLRRLTWIRPYHTGEQEDESIF